MEKFIRPDVHIDRAAVSYGGMQFWVSALIDDLEHQLIKVVADESDETLWVQLYVGDIAVQIPAAVLRRVLDQATEDVHSENWYERNLPCEGDA